MSAAEHFISKLPSAKPVPSGPHRNRWLALCPSHSDKNPSLAITEKQDGRLLLKCWHGCGANEIVSAIGLELKDLFPPSRNFEPVFYRPKNQHQEYSDDEVLLGILELTEREGKTLTPEEVTAQRRAMMRLMQRGR